jgi:voltage-gated potassium channel
MLLHVWRLLKALARVLRHPEGRALSALVLVQLLGGTIFYTLTEGWRWLDAFYFSVTTLATVGLGDLAPETDAGKLFTVVFIFTGVGLLASFVAILARQLRRPADNEDRG